MTKKPAPLSIEDEFSRLRAAYQNVPTLEQLEVLEQLAARVSLVEPGPDQPGATHGYADSSTGKDIDPEVVDQLLQQADRRSWMMDEAELYLAGIVARIPANASWRSLSAAQRHSLTAWRTRHPELTYATLLADGPINARVRLHLHNALKAGRHALPADDEPEDQPGRAGDSSRPRAAGTPEPAPKHETLAERMGRVESALNGLTAKLRSHQTEGQPVTGMAQSSADAPADEPELQLAGAPQLAPPAYIQADSIDEKTWADIIDQGLRPPETANGFIRFDPYGAANTLSDGVVYYFDKVDLPIPEGHLPYLVKHLAFYNNLATKADEEMRAGQYIWFPERTVLEAWTHETIPKK